MDNHTQINLEAFPLSFKNKHKGGPLTRHKTSSFSIDKETLVITDTLKDIHALNNYDKDCKMPFTFEGKLYLKSSVNNSIFDYDDENKVIGEWNTIQKKIDFVDYSMK